MKYARLIKNVIEGEYVYACLNQSGYVGLGEVISAAVPINEFRLSDGSRLISDQLEQPRLSSTTPMTLRTVNTFLASSGFPPGRPAPALRRHGIR